MFENFFSMDGIYSRTMNMIWNFLVLSVLWILCSLPVFTIGASSAAAYYAAAKVLRHKNGRVMPEFFSSFRSNFRQCLGLNAILGVVGILVFLECVYLYSDASVPLGMLYLFYLMFLVVDSCCIYIWPVLSRFSMSSFQFLRMSVILVFRHLLTTIILLLLQAAVLLGIYLMPWGLLIFPGIGWYVSTFAMEKILLHYSPAVDENAPEAQKWYYQ